MSEKVIIVGGSHAAVSCADNLRKHGFDGAVSMFSRESALPYQRPPLSKGYMSGAMTLERLHLRPAEWYDAKAIDLHLNTGIASIDRAARQIVAANGARHDYSTLVLATGADARHLPAEAGGALRNVHVMRDLADADRLKSVMTEGQKVAIIGGGYIGLEAAAESSKAGLEVTVIEAAPRILQRVACEETADAFRALHQAHGVTILEDTQITGIIDGENDKATGVALDNGEHLPCDLVIIGIGVSPNTELALAAGLDVAVGILVDAHGQTNDPDVYACGDCTVLPFNNMPTRLESVQNAHDQAAVVAANIAGAETLYEPEPWFWSDQYDMKLQIAGLNRGYDTIVTRAGKREGNVSHFYFQGDRFLAVDCLNDAATYMMSRKILADRKALT
ncbi:MAG: FAD-dependent oxidoreductase, partial [Pseudomonadota bacterium]